MTRITTNDQGWLEPTVFGAVRRFWVMVLLIALLAAASAVGYTLMSPALYRADATITVPPTTQAQNDTGDQYFDSQVVLLRSSEVAERAAQIADAALNRDLLSTNDFLPESGLLKITPPEGANPGTYGSSLISLSFTSDDPRVAQIGANAVLQAFDDARVAAITAEGEAAVAAIERTMRDARTRGQLSDLVDMRTKRLVDQEVDVSRHPTFGWAVIPQTPVNGNSKRAGLIGLFVGAVLGAALAYARALRRQPIGGPGAAAAIYDAPLIGEVPTPREPVGRGVEARDLSVVTEPGSPAAESYRMAAGYLDSIRLAREGSLVAAVVAATAGQQKSLVLANLALAAAERGTSVLAIDADAGPLTTLLVPGSAQAGGLDQVLDGQLSMSECLQPSKVDPRIAVLGAPASAGGARSGGARSGGVPYTKAIEELVAEASASFDLVLIDSPPLLVKAEANELAAKAEAAIVLVGPDDPVREHLTMVKRLDLVGSAVVGYLFWTRSGRSWSSWRLPQPRAARQRRDAELSSTVPTWD